MKTKIICVCKNAIIDQKKGSLSIIDIYYSFKVPSLPIIVPEIYMVFVSERQKGDKQKIDLELILKLNKKILGKQNIKIDYMDMNYNNCVFSINGLIIDEVGILSFAVKRDNRQIAKYECVVEKIQTKIVKV